MAQSENLTTRVERLRRRLVAREIVDPGNGASTPQPLQERLGNLGARIHRQTEEAARDANSLQEEIARATEPEAKPATTADDLTNGARRVLERAEASLMRVHEIEKGRPGAEPSDDTANQALRATRLAELVTRTVRQSAHAANRQIDSLPALEAVCDHLDAITGELEHAVAFRTREDSVLAEVMRLHQRFVRHEPVAFDDLRALAATVIEDVECHAYPNRTIRDVSEARTRIAVHAIDSARVVAFLTSSDPAWRVHQTPLVAAALLADAFMLMAPAEVHTQSGPLTSDQRAKLERHPIEAGVLLERVAGLDPLFARAAARHHERVDGSGYPAGLAGADLSQADRLLAVADAYCARREPRPHRRALSAKQALTETLNEGELGGLDSTWACRLLDLSLYPVGARVELSTGEIAEVVAPQEAADSPTLAALPIVRIHRSRSGAPLHRPVYRNLAQRRECRIIRQLADFEAA